MIYWKKQTIDEKLTIGKFPDNTVNLSIPQEMLDEKSITIGWNYESDRELFALACIVDTLRRNNQYVDIRLWLPYVPNARMDRVKDPTESFTLQTFCDMINNMNFSEVSVLDVHSNVTLGMLKRSHDNPNLVKGNIDKVRGYIGVDSILFFPDAGAYKRYTTLFDGTGITTLYGSKHRDWKTGVIQGLKVNNDYGDTLDVDGKNILIIDDICSRGGTALRSASALWSMGASDIYVYVTHCEKTVIGSDLYHSSIKGIYTTDSIINSDILQRLDTKHKII